MELEDKSLGEIPNEPAEGHEESGSQKPYTSPRLVEWGSIIDLTQGPLLGSKDFPFKGGTRPT
jgi:hypothetical protein